MMRNLQSLQSNIMRIIIPKLTFCNSLSTRVLVSKNSFKYLNMKVHADIDTVKVVVKNVPDYAAGKEKNDLGFLTFDLQVGKMISYHNCV